MKLFLKPYKGCSLSDITQGFSDTHHALDFLPKRKMGLGAYGTPLVCPENVTVTKIYDEIDSTLFNGFGIWMQGESGYLHEYWHTQPVFPVKEGDVLLKGTIVAYVGNSGNVMSGGVYVPLDQRDIPPELGTHLHLELVDYVGENKGHLISPLPFIDFDTEPTYTMMDELKASAIVLGKIAGLLKT